MGRARRLPRPVYWIAGGALAIAAALAGRWMASQFDGSIRLIAWAAAAALIFIGLAVASLGTRYRDQGHDRTGTEPGPR
jgi:hypothetical protein